MNKEKNLSDKENNLKSESSLKKWAFKDSLNPVIIGDKNIALRLQSFFVTSPLLVHFDHNAMFDEYSEKNLLIIIGPLSDVQIEKIKRIAKSMIHKFKVVYLEMLFKDIDNHEDYVKSVEEMIELEIDKFLIENFISLDNVASILREIA